MISQLSTEKNPNKGDELESVICNQGRAIANVEESFKSQLEKIFLEYLCTNNKAIPKTGKRSAFEILNEIYKNEYRNIFPKRAAVE